MAEEFGNFLMLVGIPASGKSTFAQELAEGRDDVVIISSDALREELLGDVNSQEKNKDIFEEMAIRTKKTLKDGKHVIYDATNLNRKKRKGLLQQLPKTVSKNVVYISSSHKTAFNNNMNRDRKVPHDVLDLMYKNLQIPIKSEGWDNIEFYHSDETMNNELPKQFADAVRLAVILNREGIELMNFLASYFEEFFGIYDLAHDSKWHSLSVHRHTYYVYKHVLEHYETDSEREKEVMLWTALLHDTGKHFAKSFTDYKGEETRYANFIGHENVSAQLAVSLLKRLGFGDDFIKEVITLIQFHMYLLDEKANRKKLEALVGEEVFKKLEFLRDADTLAH